MIKFVLSAAFSSQIPIVHCRFYGLLAWGIISRISLPLLIFYRFHSCVVLVEIWKNTYRTKVLVINLNYFCGIYFISAFRRHSEGVRGPRPS